MSNATQLFLHKIYPLVPSTHDYVSILTLVEGSRVVRPHALPAPLLKSPQYSPLCPLLTELLFVVAVLEALKGDLALGNVVFLLFEH